jgi:hypothetical protein
MTGKTGRAARVKARATFLKDETEIVTGWPWSEDGSIVLQMLNASLANALINRQTKKPRKLVACEAF